MTTQPIERTDLEIIEALDWDFAPACEHSEHDGDPVHGGDAAVLATHAACCCSAAKALYLCEGFWKWTQKPWAIIECHGCGMEWAPAREAYLNVRPVK